MYRRNDEMLKMGLQNKLIYAVAINDIDGIKERLKNISKRQLEMKYLSYDNALLLAANDNNIEAIKLLLQAGANIETKDISGCTPLAIALKKGYEDVAYYLLDKGSSVCHQSNRKISILHYAAAGCSQRMIDNLLDMGLDINYLASGSVSALDFTTDISSKGNYEAAKALVDNGISNGIITKAFKEACWRGNDKIAKMLLDAGADINIVFGERGNRPETLFWLCKMPGSLQKTRYLKTIRLLIEQGINFEEKYKFIGRIIDGIGSPLQKAKEENFFDAVKLIKQGEW